MSLIYSDAARSVQLGHKAQLPLLSKQLPHFTIQLHDRNIGFVKSKEDVAAKQEVEYFKDGKLQSTPRAVDVVDESRAAFDRTVALIRTLQGSDAFGVDMLPFAKRNQQFNKMAGGLHNPGINICFMNVVLQVVTHSPYLAPALIRAAHARVCRNAKRKIICVTCILEAHVKRALNTSAPTKNPFTHLVQKLIWRQYQLGRQEDAFIFLKHFLEALIKGCYGSKYPYNSTGVLPQEDVMRSVIGRIFGGYLLNVLICAKCNYKSEKLETCFDISVDVQRANKLIDLLNLFVKEETLDSHNKYNCPKCTRHQRATKAMSVFRAPRIMNIVLKRFGVSSAGLEKSKKEVAFPPSFSMSLHTSNQEQPVWLTYDLYAVVCHLGRSLDMGHYVAFVKGQHGMWNFYNDASVSTVSQNVVLGLKQEAYLLFYALKEDCVQICDMLTNDNGITNVFTTAPVPPHRNLQSNIVHYRTDVLRAEALAEDTSTDQWSTWTSYDAGMPIASLKRWESVQSDGTPSPTSSIESIENAMSALLEPEKAQEALQRMEKVQAGRAESARRFVTRRRHGHRLRLLGLYRRRVVSQQIMRDILRIKEQVIRRLLEEERNRGAAAEAKVEDSGEAPVQEALPLDARGDSDVDTWSDAEPGEGYAELKSNIHPELPKRSQEDVDYDRGKLKKKKGEPQPPVGAMQEVAHASGLKIAVHQKGAFDRVARSKKEGRRLGGAKRDRRDRRKKPFRRA
ncbi:peptidase C19 family protein [Babesia caballi]|uniref:ubiquitinyl hydrolase 1 n=1 Tax=Babesia caballi TaxID=5871 RepID=A0AAV4LL89_BABCB|nr:peptidase C19 family protein [Babesia caballi]